jgi:hypothetical protein
MKSGKRRFTNPDSLNTTAGLFLARLFSFISIDIRGKHNTIRGDIDGDFYPGLKPGLAQPLALEMNIRGVGVAPAGDVADDKVLKRAASAARKPIITKHPLAQPPHDISHNAW